MVAKHPMIGRILANDYKIVSLLGRGGMGSVFNACQLSLNREVAIKLFPTCDMTQAEWKRFEIEIATMASISHSNIVTIHHRDKFGDPPTLFYVMEVMPGGSLRNYLNQNGKMLPSNVLRIMRPIAEGLNYAHEKGCIHRDIKPDNLLFDRNYRNLKIADFGIAKWKSDISITQSQAMVGTYIYASPEQMNWYDTDEDIDAIEIDGRADQYSLGVVMYEMISGAPPYQAKNMMSLMKALENPPTPLSERVPTISSSVDWLISTMISRPRDDRFANDEELLAAMDSVELEVAASVSARVFIPKKQNDTSTSSSRPASLPSKAEKEFIQSLRTITHRNSSDIIQKCKRVLIFSVGVLMALVAIITFYEFFIHNRIMKRKVAVVTNIQYDIIPPKNYAKPSIQLVPYGKNEEPIEIENHVEIKPNNYIIFAKLEGYSCLQNNATIVVKSKPKTLLLQVKLVAKTRPMYPMIIDLTNQSKVVPIVFTVDGLSVKKQKSFKPGNHNIELNFQSYEEVHKNIFVSPGEKPIQLRFYLRPLREIVLDLDTVVVRPNGEFYPLEVFVAQKSLGKNYYKSIVKKSRLRCSIRVASNVKKITLRCGYFYQKVEMEKIYLLNELSLLDVDRMLQHLSLTKREDLKREIKNLLDNHLGKIQQLLVEKKQTLYKFLVSLLDGERPNIEHPGWKLRRILNEKEQKETKEFMNVQSLELSVGEKQKLWKKFVNKYPEGIFIIEVKNNIDYCQRVLDYRKNLHSSVKDCYVSASEKRTIINLASKINKVDENIAREQVRKYLQKRHCGESLEKMLK